MKLAVIGGGSTYTPELAEGLGRLAPQVTEVVRGEIRQRFQPL